jgi:hypothetical protein
MPAVSTAGCVLTVWLSSASGPSLTTFPEEIEAQHRGGFVEGLPHLRQVGERIQHADRLRTLAGDTKASVIGLLL